MLNCNSVINLLLFADGKEVGVWGLQDACRYPNRNFCTGDLFYEIRYRCMPLETLQLHDQSFVILRCTDFALCDFFHGQNCIQHFGLSASHYDILTAREIELSS